MRKGVRLPLEQLQPYLLPFPQPEQLLDLSEIFGNRNPVELEVGFGKGSFLIASSPLHPERNFLGIETDRGLQLYVANRIARRLLTNIKLLHGDASRLLAVHLPSSSIQTIHIYFPDPWWKKRHLKRRVFTPTFAEHCTKVLIPQGELHFATDVAEYFQIIVGIMALRPELETIGADRIEAVNPESLPQTNFEKKALEQGRTVWRAVFRRI